MPQLTGFEPDAALNSENLSDMSGHEPEEEVATPDTAKSPVVPSSADNNVDSAERGSDRHSPAKHKDTTPKQNSEPHKDKTPVLTPRKNDNGQFRKRCRVSLSPTEDRTLKNPRLSTLTKGTRATVSCPAFEGSGGNLVTPYTSKDNASLKKETLQRPNGPCLRPLGAKRNSKHKDFKIYEDPACSSPTVRCMVKPLSPDLPKENIDPVIRDSNSPEEYQLPRARASRPLSTAHGIPMSTPGWTLARPSLRQRTTDESPPGELPDSSSAVDSDDDECSYDEDVDLYSLQQAAETRHQVDLSHTSLGSQMFGQQSSLLDSSASRQSRSNNSRLSDEEVDSSAERVKRPGARRMATTPRGRQLPSRTLIQARHASTARHKASETTERAKDGAVEG